MKVGLDDRINPEDKSILTLAMVSEYLNLKEEDIFDLIKTKSIPYAKLGKTYLFPKWMIDR